MIVLESSTSGYGAVDKETAERESRFINVTSSIKPHWRKAPPVESYNVSRIREM